MYCEQCGSPLDPDAKFCTFCGARVNAAPSGITEHAGSGGATYGAIDVNATSSADDNHPGPAVRYSTGPQASEVDAASSGGKEKRTAFIAVAAVAVIAIVAAASVFLINGGIAGSSSAGGNAWQSQPLGELIVTQVDNVSFPEVTLYAQILDDDSLPVENVTADNIKISEFNSSGQEIEDVVSAVTMMSDVDVLNINLVLDQSGSMSNGSRMADAKSAANAFIGELVKDGSFEAEITAFASEVHNNQPFTSNHELLSSAVNSLRPDGETALNDALYWALQRTNLKAGARAVIAFTDGEENASFYTENDVEELSRMTGIPVYIIGTGDDVSREQLEALAAECNGAYFDAEVTDLASTLQEAFDSIYESQRSLYRIVFTSASADNPEEMRTIQVSYMDDLGSNNEVVAGIEYMPVDHVDSFATKVRAEDYVLPDSARRVYSRNELEDLSLWELYLARNEIFARHGRGFKNKDLVEYFATRNWYQQRYTPEEFDAMPTPLNDTELKNVEAMYAIESEMNSPYLITAK